MRRTLENVWRNALVTLLCAATASAGEGREALPAGVDAPWLARARAGIARAEYEFRASGTASWSAPNRAQGLRAEVGPQGLVVGPRRLGGAATAWTLRLATAGFGRADAVAPTSPAAPGNARAAGERVELAHRGFLEWFVNDARGVQQGWTISARPAGDATQPVCLALEIETEMTVRIAPDARGAEFLDETGAVQVRYSGLAAWDARGAALPARIAAAHGGLAVLVEDAAAVYPITVDPVLSTGVWSVAGAQSADRLGAAVAGAGDVDGDGYSDVIVGAPSFSGTFFGEGAVFVYLGSAGGLSTTAAWSATGGADSARFGTAVSTAGDVDGDGFSDILVGAPLGAPLSAAPVANASFVALYSGSAAGLSATPAWTYTAGVAGPPLGLGHSLATAGDVNADGYSDVIVGARDFSNGEALEGAVWVFHGSAAGLPATPSWSYESDVAGARLGWSVASAGDVNGDGFDDVALGAPEADVDQADDGAVFVFLGSASGLGTGGPDATIDGSIASARLGECVASAGDVDRDGFADLLVGAGAYTDTLASQGAAFLYPGSAAGLVTTASWQVVGAQAGLSLGHSLASAGDVDGDGFDDVAVGVPAIGAPALAGEVRFFRGSAAGLATTAELVFAGAAAGEQYGACVAAAGDTDGDGYPDLAVGAPLGQGGAGSAELLCGAGELLADASDWTFDGVGTNSGLGSAIASAGDVNGDGYDDIVLGAYQYDTLIQNGGEAWLSLGGENGLETSPALVVSGTEHWGWLGRSVTGLGDVNGDGYADFGVGEPYKDLGSINEGRVLVYYGNAAGTFGAPDQLIEGQTQFGLFGWSISGGDFDGDGYGDLLAGAYGLGNPSSTGAAFIHRGSPNGLSATPTWETTGEQASARYGIQVGTAGDVNGDGIADLLVMADQFDGAFTDEGRAYLYLGAPGGPSTSPAWTFDGGQDTARLWSGSGVGDVNNDGYADIACGSWLIDGGAVDSGALWVFLGSPTGPATTPDHTLLGAIASGYFGISVDAAGDVDLDGYDDLIVGELRYNDGQFREGAMRVYRGGATGPSTTESWLYDSDQTFASLGYVAGAGDVDGDGYSDVLGGAGSFDTSTGNSGRIYCFHGNTGGGSPVRAPRQLRSDGTAPIVPGGRSDATDSFRIRAVLHPDAVSVDWGAAAAEAFLEWEVKPLGTAFDGTGLARGAVGQPVVAGGPDLMLEELVSGLAPSTAYRWRARIVTTHPFFPTTPWFTPAGANGSNEVHVRTDGPAVDAGGPSSNGNVGGSVLVRVP